MSADVPTLYGLLPAVYRIRDAEQGEPLRRLLEVVAEQSAVLMEGLEQAYDDLFVETCAEWAVAYIGDLIGYRTLHGHRPVPGVPQAILSRRAEVAHTIAYRRRKGTASMLEQLARDVSGWYARAVEFFQLLATSQNVNHVRPANHSVPDLRDWEGLERLGTPFERAAHTAEVRRISTGGGRYNIPNVGLFLWRLGPYPLTASPAFRLDDRRYLFSPLGLDIQLFTLPEAEEEISHLAEPLNVPHPISRRVLDRYLDAYYGSNRSLDISTASGTVPASDVVVCDLSDVGAGWAHQQANKVALDPVLGRLVFPTGDPPPVDVRVSFHYGFGADLGGGEYERSDALDVGLVPLTSIAMGASIPHPIPDISGAGSWEIDDSGRYTSPSLIAAPAGGRVEVRAANRHRPTLVMGGDLRITGGDEAEVTLNGLLLAGAAIRVEAGASNALKRLRLRHCTLVPASGPSLTVELPGISVEIDRCILGGVRAHADAKVRIHDSVIDATSDTAIAYADPAGGPGGDLETEAVTVIGKVHTTLLRASNTIFSARLEPGDAWTAPVRADRRQEGCLRFSFVPLSAVAPRRYRCQPTTETDVLRVRPSFTSSVYGDPGYMQLRLGVAQEIRTGADDEGEMGAFHMLLQPQRETDLRTRLDEYLRFALEAGIFYVT